MTVCPTLAQFDDYRAGFGIWYLSYCRDHHYTGSKVFLGLQSAEVENEYAMSAKSDGCIRVQPGITMTVVNTFNEADNPDPNYANEVIARVIVSMSDGSKFKGFAENDSFKGQ